MFSAFQIGAFQQTAFQISGTVPVQDHGGWYPEEHRRKPEEKRHERKRPPFLHVPRVSRYAKFPQPVAAPAVQPPVAAAPQAAMQPDPAQAQFEQEREDQEILKLLMEM